jgi:thiamine-phosphate pyrophosphorylase
VEAPALKGLRGLYAITPERSMGAAALAQAVRSAIAGGARLVQYRDKSDDADRRLIEARAVLRECVEAGIPLIVNDDLHLTIEIGATGIHLGRGDIDPRRARAELGSAALIGVSCYDDWERARTAAAAGADYVAFGSFFPSRTKPLAVRADPALLRRAHRELGLPVVAIGGITPENGGALIAAGADMLAVVNGLFGRTDVTAAARAYANLFPEID